MPIAPMGRSHGAALLLLRRRQAQVLEVEAEVGPRRDRHHQRMDDLAVRIKRESQERVRVQPAVAPAHDEGVVLPVLQVAEQLRGLRELDLRSEEHTSELQSLMRISYAVFCLKKKNKQHNKRTKQLRT